MFAGEGPLGLAVSDDETTRCGHGEFGRFEAHSSRLEDGAERGVKDYCGFLTHSVQPPICDALSCSSPDGGTQLW